MAPVLAAFIVTAALKVSGDEELLDNTKLPEPLSVREVVPPKTFPPVPLSFEDPFFTAVNVLLNLEPLNRILFPVAFTDAPKVVPAKVSVDVPEQVSVPLLIVPPLKLAVAEIVSVYALQSRVPEVIVNFLIVVLAASTGRLVWVTIVTVSLVEGFPEGLQFVPVAQSVFVVPVQV